MGKNHGEILGCVLSSVLSPVSAVLAQVVVVEEEQGGKGHIGVVVRLERNQVAHTEKAEEAGENRDFLANLWYTPPFFSALMIANGPAQFSIVFITRRSPLATFI